MNKTELINKISEGSGLTKSQSSDALDSFINAITEALQQGDKITLLGFGTFSVSKREARTGRNPQTGEVIQIKAKNVVKFKSGKELADKL